MAPKPTTVNDESLKQYIAVSAAAHILFLLIMYFGLPHLLPPLPEHHEPVPFTIVEIADITNTRLQEPEQKPPAPEPPKPQPKPEEVVKPTPPQPTPPQPPTPPKPAEPTKPQDQAESLKAAPKPQEKPKPPEPPKPQQTAAFDKLLKNLENKKQTEAPKNTDTKPDAKQVTTPSPSPAASVSDRLSITEEDLLRRQISNCWNPPIGARDAHNLVVEVIIEVNPDKTARNAEIVDKGRYNTDSFFRAAADAAVRAVLNNPKCTPLALPDGKYEQWKRIDFTFDPRDLL
ncbi:MAG: energy transducer TonB [Alphaproteobacteria bacterium]|nr:energy transducer TonB [Alphaproteobacteria bacterium]MBV8548201.1 energy transducer TonB [Alphaproteobacteria bacterium]